MITRDGPLEYNGSIRGIVSNYGQDGFLTSVVHVASSRTTHETGFLLEGFAFVMVRSAPSFRLG